MRIVRSILAALLALSLAVTPAVARSAHAVMDAPAASAAHAETAPSDMAGMPDCHRAIMQHAAQQPAKDSHHKKCPDCDKRGACNADVCQLKCFKVLGELAKDRKPVALSAERFDALASALLEPVSFKPQTPPPRI
jgi:hypothetical protein